MTSKDVFNYWDNIQQSLNQLFFEKAKQNFINHIEKYDTREIVTTCASCEKTLKSYNIEGLIVKNIFEYIREQNLKLKLKKKIRATFHKP